MNKKLTIFLCVIFISFFVGFLFFVNSDNSTANVSSLPDDSIMYDNTYEYTFENKKFLLKERGYDIIDNYRDKDVRILKKELVVSMSLIEDKNENLYYEIYDMSDNLKIRGIMYLESNCYYSNIVLNNMAEFEDELKIKIFDSKNELLYDFFIKEG